MCSDVDDVGAEHISLVVDKFVKIGRNLVLLHVVFNIFLSAIYRGIIDVDEVIIFVFLLENRVEVAQVNSIIDVVIGYDNHTKSHLLLNILRNLVFRFVIILL